MSDDLYLTVALAGLAGKLLQSMTTMGVVPSMGVDAEPRHRLSIASAERMNLPVQELLRKRSEVQTRHLKQVNQRQHFAYFGDFRRQVETDLTRQPGCVPPKPSRSGRPSSLTAKSGLVAQIARPDNRLIPLVRT